MMYLMGGEGESSEQLIRWVWGSLIHGTAEADERLLFFAIINHYGSQLLSPGR